MATSKKFLDENGLSILWNQIENNFISSDNIEVIINAIDTVKADKESPEFTGIPTAPTASPKTNTTQIATTEFVNTAISDEATRAKAAEKLNADAIAAETTRAKAAEKTNADAIAELKNADYASITSEKIAKWDTAQANVIEKIQVNGTEIAISEKTVNIPLATAARAGLIISSDAENAISVSDTGVATVNNINVNKLVQTAGDELILNGGNA